MIINASNTSHGQNYPTINVTSRVITDLGNNTYIYQIPQTINDEQFYYIGTNFTLVLKVQISNIPSFYNLSKLVFGLLTGITDTNSTLKAYKINTQLTDFPISAADLYNDISFDLSNLVDETFLTALAYYGDSSIIGRPIFDLSKIIDSTGVTEFMIAIKSDYSSLKIYEPEFLNSHGVAFISSVLVNSDGINSLSKYDEISCSNIDKGFINLSSGNNIHIFDLFSSLSKTLPISFNVSYNKNNTPS